MEVAICFRYSRSLFWLMVKPMVLLLLLSCGANSNQSIIIFLLIGQVVCSWVSRIGDWAMISKASFCASFVLFSFISGLSSIKESEIEDV